MDNTKPNDEPAARSDWLIETLTRAVDVDCRLRLGEREELGQASLSKYDDTLARLLRDNKRNYESVVKSLKQAADVIMRSTQERLVEDLARAKAEYELASSVTSNKYSDWRGLILCGLADLKQEMRDDAARKITALSSMTVTELEKAYNGEQVTKDKLTYPIEALPRKVAL